MSLFSGRRGASLWGDGFAEDTWSEIVRRDSWDACSRDEHLILFPRLVDGNGLVPAPLLATLVSCVAARAWQGVAQNPRALEGGLRSMDIDLVRRVGAKDCDAWFPDRANVLRALFDIAGASSVRRADGGAMRVLRDLDTLLDALQRGGAPPYDPHRAAAFSFHAGIHAGYVWPEAILEAERITAAGWLGHVSRGRPALMPRAVAEFIDASIVSREGRATFGDAGLDALGLDASHLDTMRRAARRRMDGLETIVLLRSPGGRGRMGRQPPWPAFEAMHA